MYQEALAQHEIWVRNYPGMKDEADRWIAEQYTLLIAPLAQDHQSQGVSAGFTQTHQCRIGAIVSGAGRRVQGCSTINHGSAV